MAKSKIKGRSGVLTHKFECGCWMYVNQRRKLCEHDVKRIRRATTRKHDRLTHAAVASEYGVHHTLISHINAYRVWRDV